MREIDFEIRALMKLYVRESECRVMHCFIIFNIIIRRARESTKKNWIPGSFFPFFPSLNSSRIFRGVRAFFFTRIIRNCILLVFWLLQKVQKGSWKIRLCRSRKQLFNCKRILSHNIIMVESVTKKNLKLFDPKKMNLDSNRVIRICKTVS